MPFKKLVKLQERELGDINIILKYKTLGFQARFIRVTKFKTPKKHSFFGTRVFLSKPTGLVYHQPDRAVYHRRRHISSHEVCISVGLMIYNASH